MAQYIDKSAIVAEIERLAEVKPIDELQPQVQNKIDWLSGKLFAINSLRVFLDTIEVKEVDLNEEIELVKGDYEQVDVAWNNDFDYIAKHFFELGLRSTITEEDCKLIWNIGDEIPCMTEEEFFKELLRRYKAHKGEEV
jgi:uncharacterized protein YbaR (Trm112 family)